MYKWILVPKDMFLSQPEQILLKSNPVFWLLNDSIARLNTTHFVKSVMQAPSSSSSDSSSAKYSKYATY